MKIAKEDLNLLIQFQRNEITEHLFYDILSKRGKGKNKEVLEKISSDELKHYNIIKNFTNLEIKENKFFIYKNLILTYIFGLTFGIKLMENGESKAQKKLRESYKQP